MSEIESNKTQQGPVKTAEISNASLIAQGVLCLGLIGGTFAAMAFLGASSSRFHGQTYDDVIKRVDQSPTVIFNSVSDCVDCGYTKAECEESLEKAIERADNDPAFRYESEDEALKNHISVEPKEWLQAYPLVPVPGGRPLVSTLNRTDFKAAVEGWQAPADDITTDAVPLYSGETENTLLRADGQTFRRTP